MKRNNSKDTSYSLPKWYKIAIIVIAAVVIIVPIASYLYWRNSLTTFDEAIRECGGKRPVQTTAMMGREYTLPSDKSYRMPNDGNEVITDYFCTEDEAKAAGYRHSAF